MFCILHHFNSPTFPDFLFYFYPLPKEIASLQLAGISDWSLFRSPFSPDINFARAEPRERGHLRCIPKPLKA